MTTPSIAAFDHLVLVCRDTEATLAWYVDRLGLAPVRVEEWRAGRVPFPSVRVSADTIIDLLPSRPRPGDAADRAEHAPTGSNLDHLCLVADRATVDHLADLANGYDVLEGPVVRFGARGDGLSVYVRDPEGTVVEIRTYDDGSDEAAGDDRGR